MKSLFTSLFAAVRREHLKLAVRTGVRRVAAGWCAIVNENHMFIRV